MAADVASLSAQRRAKPLSQLERLDLGAVVAVVEHALRQDNIEVRGHIRGGCNWVLFVHRSSDSTSEHPCAIVRIQSDLFKSDMTDVFAALPKLPGDPEGELFHPPSLVGWLCSEISTIEYLHYISTFRPRVSPVLAYDFRSGEENVLGAPYMVQEYLPGKTFLETFKQHGVPSSGDRDWSFLARAAAAVQLQMTDPTLLRMLPMRTAPDAKPGTDFRIQCSYLQQDHCPNVSELRSRYKRSEKHTPTFFIERCNAFREQEDLPVPTYEALSVSFCRGSAALEWLRERWAAYLDAWCSTRHEWEAMLKGPSKTLMSLRKKPPIMLATSGATNGDGTIQRPHRVANLARSLRRRSSKVDLASYVTRATRFVEALDAFNREIGAITEAALQLIAELSPCLEELWTALYANEAGHDATENRILQTAAASELDASSAGNMPTAGVLHNKGRAEGSDASASVWSGLTLCHQDFALRNLLFNDSIEAGAVIDWSFCTLMPWPLCLSDVAELGIPQLSVRDMPPSRKRSAYDMYPDVDSQAAELAAFGTDWPGARYSSSFKERRRAVLRHTAFVSSRRALLLERIKSSAKYSTRAMTAKEESAWMKKLNDLDAIVDLMAGIDELIKQAVWWKPTYKLWAERLLDRTREALKREPAEPVEGEDGCCSMDAEMLAAAPAGTAASVAAP